MRTIGTFSILGLLFPLAVLLLVPSCGSSTPPPLARETLMAMEEIDSAFTVGLSYRDFGSKLILAGNS